MKKRLAMILVCALTLILSACGNESAETNDTSTESSVEITETAETIGSIETNTTIAETESTEENIESIQTSDQNNTTTTGHIAESTLATFLSIHASDPDLSAEDMANRIIDECNFPFAGATMAVEPGFLNGFSSEISGFTEGAVFSPMIGSIPFVGYIFQLENDSDTDAFIQQLRDNADLRWNICTEADDMVIEADGQTVFFLMCPTAFEE